MVQLYIPKQLLFKLSSQTDTAYVKKYIKLTNLDLIFKKPLLLNKLGLHPLSCRLGLPQVLFQFLKKLKSIVW